MSHINTVSFVSVFYVTFYTLFGTKRMRKLNNTQHGRVPLNRHLLKRLRKKWTESREASRAVQGAQALGVDWLN
ncbi:hypothetical protein QWZ16_18040 [Vibrio ostreicida]|uniref:Uncharacterized protein n=1 Tax=Vibrio ostreicida TaxID=526588 RepID=A0ABT8BXF9_9VIBR|nr:hypothetical protein [Vibrio ostreicida]MDN3611502.1 hypothetical protein [Vibrio ostreicida]